ncbi:hypothetical protein O181_005985 [Austropuccinia psidii MF-1]|uniref:Uncharacterized protein n=1 Tax=Austropuccinia psidii MF-1 TaxID=1389203 RepID=A0A9Q3GGD8_9BASI|nr:hypothetical protein [Austropuccinia psidii MF-1]
MEPTSNGYFNFHQFIKAHHPEDSSSLKKKCQSPIPMTPSSHHWLLLTHSIPPREYWKITLKGYSRGSSKTIFRVSVLHQSTLATRLIQYSLHSSRPVLSFIHHGKFIQPSLFPNLTRYKLHQEVNKGSRIQYRPAVSLKKSRSQVFTYTSLH